MPINKNQSLYFQIYHQKEVIKINQMSNSAELKQQLIYYFRAVGSGQNIVQCLKQVLFLHERFNPVLLFQKISNGKQKITIKNWKQYMISVNLHFNEREFKYFLKQNSYKAEVTLNELLESLIPFNGDVLRKFKDKCSQSIKIPKLDQQVQFIFIQMLDKQLNFFRTLINIRDSITQLASTKQIEELVKKSLLDDLRQNNLQRELGKLIEHFKKPDFKLSFDQLRKVFKVWVPEHDLVIQELCMLNIMRHLKSDDPFGKIVFKNKRKHAKNNNTAISPSRSIQQRSSQPFSNEKLRNSQNKYNQYKMMILNSFQEGQRQQSPDKVKQQNSPLINNLFNGRNSNQRQGYIDVIKNVNPSKQQSYKKVDKQPKGNSINIGQNSNTNSNTKRQESNYIRPEQQIGRSSNYGKPRQKIQQKSHKMSGIVDLLQQIITKQEQLEQLRKTVAKNSDFSLINLYNLIDAKNQRFITSRDIQRFCQTKMPFEYLVNFYSKQPDIILFNQFCLIFRPLSRQLNEMLDSRPQSILPDPFKKDTMQMILTILKLSGELHLNLYKIRQSLQRQNPQSIFNYLDNKGQGYLDVQSFKRVLRAKNIPSEDRNLKCLMKLMKKRINETVEYPQFLNFISP